MTAKLIATGEITRTRAAARALAAGGHSTARLLVRHLGGDRGRAAAQNYTARLRLAGERPAERVISHYEWPDGPAVTVVTHYPAEPTLRWTEICLAAELAAELAELAAAAGDNDEPEIPIDDNDTQEEAMPIFTPAPESAGLTTAPVPVALAAGGGE